MKNQTFGIEIETTGIGREKTAKAIAAFTTDGGHTQLQLRVGEGVDTLDVTLYPQLEMGENVTAFEPYLGALYSFDTDGELVEGEVEPAARPRPTSAP